MQSPLSVYVTSSHPLSSLGWTDVNSVILPYGELWRRHRRLLHELFRPEAAARYQEIQTKKIHDTLRGILDTPENFMMHVRT